MNYMKTRFDMFWGYGPLGLAHWRSESAVVQETVDLLVAASGTSADLACKANLFRTRVQVTGTRKIAYSAGETLLAILPVKTTGLAECGIYVYDNDFSPERPPRLFLNFHAADGDEIGGRALALPDGGDRARTFLLFAVARCNPETLDIEAIAEHACCALDLTYAYVFHNVGYKYDGLTPLEWAYKNHSARLRSGILEDLSPTMGERLR